MSRLCIGTYNVHKCQGLDRRVRVERIRRVIEELNVDLLATQEILRSQAEQISADLAMPHWFGRAREHAGEDYGNATFTSLPVDSEECFNLTVANREPRQCLLLAIGPLRFLNVHLGTGFRERRQQARLLLSPQLLDRPDLQGRRIVAGDFNEWSKGLATQLLSQKLTSADHRKHLGQKSSFPGILPFLHLDHIYYDPAFHLQSMKLHRSRTALLASDHLPLWAEFCF